MLKYAEAPEDQVLIAKPRRKPVDIDAGFKRALERFPKIIKRLGE